MLEAGDWLVVVDTVSIADSSLGKRYRALQVLPHPRFNKYSNDYDVGLLHTITDMDMTGERTIPVPIHEFVRYCRFSKIKLMLFNYFKRSATIRQQR